MTPHLYSIRMRASSGDKHISGAERIVHEADIQAVCAALLDRARSHTRGVPTSINISVDSLADREIIILPTLPVSEHTASDPGAALGIAIRELVRAGVSEKAAGSAIFSILQGANPLRGAMLIDAKTGERLDPELVRGVRARAVDFAPDYLPELERELPSHGLEGTRIKEALALATKAANAPGAVAELCLSDNPDYVTGYVASKAHGYSRITPLKKQGDTIGGRAFFVDGGGFSLDDYLHYMREVAVLVMGPLVVS